MTEFFSAGLAIGSMRDTGYKDAAAALAEIIDNAVQAKATRVEVLISERETMVVHKSSWRAERIAVLDNGVGMNEEVLTAALQFGNGAYREDRSGIGRFGMGLPQSTISQCKRVDVYSWQDGPDKAIHTYLDIDAIEAGDSEVPPPEHREIPPTWRDAAMDFGPTGTLVIWSKLDRCQWKTGDAILRNTQKPVGRMYRYYLSNDEVQIRFATFDEEKPKKPRQDYFVAPNDPLYLMEGTSCPAVTVKDPETGKDTKTSAIFDETEPQTFELKDQDDNLHEVLVRYSMAKSEARERVDGVAAGNLDHGKHARTNRGISLVRNRRELDLDTSMLEGDVFRDRWWGCEIQFPAELDELFGVTNSKQSAVHFTSAMQQWRSTRSDRDSSFLSTLEELKANGDPKYQLYMLIQDVMKYIANLEKLIHVQNKGQETDPAKTNERSAVAKATRVVEDRRARGSKGLTDDAADGDDAERRKELERQFGEDGLSPEAAAARALTLVERGYRFDFREDELSGSMFFDLRRTAGVITITLNSKHQAYKNLLNVLLSKPEDEISKERLLSLLGDARDSLQLLFYAWARLEDEETNDEKREQIEDVRYEWGRFLAQFFRDGE